MKTRKRMNKKVNPGGTSKNDGTTTNQQTTIIPDSKDTTAITKPPLAVDKVVNREHDRMLAELNAENENIKRRQELILATQTTPSSHSSPSSRLSSATLVPIEAITKIVAILRPEPQDPLPRFDGNVLQWPEFLLEFRSSTLQRNLTNEDNIERLRKALHGSARSYVKGQLDEECFVDDIIERLQHKFGGDDALETYAFAKAQKLRYLDRDNTRLSNFTLDAIRIHTTVKRCGNSSLGKHILMILRDKLTPALISAWLTFQRGLKRNGNLDDFMDWLKRTRTEYEDIQFNSRRNDRSSEPYGRPTGSSYRCYDRPSSDPSFRRPHRL